MLRAVSDNRLASALRLLHMDEFIPLKTDDEYLEALSSRGSAIYFAYA